MQLRFSLIDKEEKRVAQPCRAKACGKFTNASSSSLGRVEKSVNFDSVYLAHLRAISSRYKIILLKESVRDKTIVNEEAKVKNSLERVEQQQQGRKLFLN